MNMTSRVSPHLRFLGMVVRMFRNTRDHVKVGIVEYLKKQSGPASAEIKTVEDASGIIEDKKIVIVGVFPKFSGEEFENFMAVVDKLRADYDFAHTTDAKLVPRGESSVTGALVRLLKPFDELFVDSKVLLVDFKSGSFHNPVLLEIDVISYVLLCH
ncbi:protein disulfide-isomerase-like isoform X1 [Cannabis sativa]|uniref:protein disulfide-isomerase-like isoform X1 n=2 Tax=Cannabis sativa TaxID=3483 RepID=UPI0029CA2375|nr:protein disulfide-isomerase-like isoform X1 [Cannabis sativa]XP_060974865.1 protein disulfide-isomerase-like isoform X1 [Cannabis sativa]